MGRLDLYENIDVVVQQGTGLIEYYRRDPVMAAYDLLRVDLAPIQRIVLRDMWFKNFDITVMGRGGGKTFMLGVNAVLHALLYPGYRVGLIAPSFRQCFFNDFDYLPIFTNKGLITSPKKFYDSIDDDTKIQSLKDNNSILNKWVNAKSDGLIIKTEKGFEIGGLYDHRILVLDKCELIWKTLKDVTMNDNIVIKKGFELFGNIDEFPKHCLLKDWRTNKCKIPNNINKNISYLFGLIVGDGCISYKNGKYRINFTSESSSLINEFKNVMANYFDINKFSEYTKEGKTRQIEVYNKNLCDFFIECGFTTTNALDKKIPHVINRSSKINVISFLSGLMDTDGGMDIQQGGASISFSTSSLQLAKEVQAWFLNLGIVSSLGIDKKNSLRKLNGRDKYSNCATSYKVRITNVIDMIKFRDCVGFRLKYKDRALNNYIDGINFNKVKNSYVIPGSEILVRPLVEDCSKLFKYGDIYSNKFLGYFKNKFGRNKGFTKEKINQLLDFADNIGVCNKEYYKLKELLYKDIVFVKPVEIVPHSAETIDIEVDNESCYWAGGFINHNSKMIFSEVEKIYQRSSILREAVEKKPTRGSDTCFLKFKGTDKSNGSYIEALPIGVDGAKIRGSRFYLIQIDELAQMPTDIIDLVIRPMAAVSLEPMQRVRERERQEELISRGLATEDDFIGETANKMIMTSSGFFKFNHMWRRMKSYWKAIEEEGENTKYAVHQVPYQLLPKGFLDEENIKEARRTMSSIEFMMEYEAAMVSDSDGFFKASMIEACTEGSNFTIQLSGKPSRSYVMGVDPNQGGSASCGVIIIEMGDPNKIIYVKELKKKTTQQMVESIQKLSESFNIKRIFMDSQGGGKPIRDLLQEGYGGKIPIIDIDDENMKGRDGRRILQLVNPTTQWISDANFDSLALFEHKELRFPQLPTSADPIAEKLYEEVRVLKSQLLNIIVTQTARGVRHFDTPKKGQNKDLYSALVLAAWGVRELTRELEEEDKFVHNGGMVRPRQPNAAFRQLSGHGKIGNPNLSGAVLKKSN